MKFLFPLAVLAFSFLMGGSLADETHLKGKDSKSAMASAIYAALNKPNYGGPYGSFQLGYNYNNGYNRPAVGAYGASLGSLYGGSMYGGSLYGKPSNNVIDLNNLMSASYGSLGAGSQYGSGQYGALSAYSRPTSYAGNNYALAAANAYNANSYANIANSYANAASSYGVVPSYAAGGYRGALKVNRMSEDEDQA